MFPRQAIYRLLLRQGLINFARVGTAVPCLPSMFSRFYTADSQHGRSIFPWQPGGGSCLQQCVSLGSGGEVHTPLKKCSFTADDGAWRPSAPRLWPPCTILSEWGHLGVGVILAARVSVLRSQGVGLPTVKV